MEPATAVQEVLPIPARAEFIVQGYGARGGVFGGKKLEQMDIRRYGPNARELLIEVLYCGVSHSDIHQVGNDWKNTLYPCVPGHEIIGRVQQTGTEVTKFKEGDIAGVGCLIGSCGRCESCRAGEEQYCQGTHGPTMTYNGYFVPDGRESNTFGGFSTHLVVHEDFTVLIPPGLKINAAAPVLCAGVTVYSPLKHWNIKENSRVGIVGIGGLGHMAVMIAKAMGAYVVAITTREEKRRAALALGADEVLVSENDSEMQSHEMGLDFILCTIPETFDVNPYVCLLNRRGKLVSVGLMGFYRQPLDNLEASRMGRCIGGSFAGGMAETAKVLDFCVANQITPQVEMIRMQEINEAFERIKDGKARFRYVIDMQSLK